VNEIDGVADIAGQTLQILNKSIQTSSCSLTIPKAVASPTDSPSIRRHSILCLCGQVELELDGQNYSLKPGDNLAFNSDAFHRWRSTGTTTGIAVLIIPNNPSGREQV
jgi:quercetin dioxygenase-like cupin family protein